MKFATIATTAFIAGVILTSSAMAQTADNPSLQWHQVVTGNCYTSFENSVVPCMPNVSIMKRANGPIAIGFMRDMKNMFLVIGNQEIDNGINDQILVVDAFSITTDGVVNAKRASGTCRFHRIQGDDKPTYIRCEVPTDDGIYPFNLVVDNITSVQSGTL